MSCRFLYHDLVDRALELAYARVEPAQRFLFSEQACGLHSAARRDLRARYRDAQRPEKLSVFDAELFHKRVQRFFERFQRIIRLCFKKRLGFKQ